MSQIRKANSQTKINECSVIRTGVLSLSSSISLSCARLFSLGERSNSRIVSIRKYKLRRQGHTVRIRCFKLPNVKWSYLSTILIFNHRRCKLSLVRYIWIVVQHWFYFFVGKTLVPWLDPCISSCFWFLPFIGNCDRFVAFIS